MKKIIKSLISAKQESFLFTKDIIKNSCVNIGDYTYGRPIIFFWDNQTKLEIGKFCSIADNVRILLGGNHRIDWVSTYPFNVLSKDFSHGHNIIGHPATNGNIKIGSDVWIGNDVIILSGVEVGNGAVIGAGSLVSKSVKPYEVVGGNPIKTLKKRFTDDSISKLLEIAWWNWPIHKINENIHLICSNDITKFIEKHDVNQMSSNV